jgi:hypothetical protein
MYLNIHTVRGVSVWSCTLKYFISTDKVDTGTTNLAGNDK